MKGTTQMMITKPTEINLALTIYECGTLNDEKYKDKGQNYYRLYYINDGSVAITVDGKKMKIEQDKGFIIFPGKKFTIEAEEKETLMKIKWIAFSGHLVDTYLYRSEITETSPLFYDNQKLEIKNLMNKIIDQAQHLPNRYCVMLGDLYYIFAILLDNSIKKSRLPSYTNEYYLMQTLDYIDQKYNQPITIEEIARYLGVTRNHLYNVFKNLTDSSPKDYLTKYRMRKAIRFLKDDRHTIEEVGYKVGYTNQFHFSKEFKKVVGESPSQYRKSKRVVIEKMIEQQM